MGGRSFTTPISPRPSRRCVLEALTRPGRLFSPRPVWARLFLAWIDALAVEGSSCAALLPAAVACECVGTGFDLIDDVYDHAHGPALDGELTNALPAGVALLQLAQDAVSRLDLPLERRAQAGAALARASRRVFVAQAGDYALRRQPRATQDDILAVLRHRSGALGAAPCHCAALLTGAPWRTIALAGRFGRAIGCAAQLEDDLADLADDMRDGRKTIPTILAHLYPAQSELVEATTWVMSQRFLQEAAQAVQRLPAHVRTEPLWTFLPPVMRAA